MNQHKTFLMTGKQQLCYVDCAYIDLVRDNYNIIHPAFVIAARYSRQDKVNSDYVGAYITNKLNRNGNLTHQQLIGFGRVGVANINRLLDLNNIKHPQTETQWLAVAQRYRKKPFIHFNDQNSPVVAFEATIFKPINQQDKVHDLPVYVFNPKTINAVGHGGINVSFDANLERQLNQVVVEKHLNKVKEQELTPEI